jgi:Tol biopolymer transport system component
LPGASLRQITAFERECVRTIAIAPDGGEIVVTADVDGDERHQIYSIAAGHDNPRRWESDPRIQHFLDQGGWSPDGTKLAYAASAREKADMEVWVRERSSGHVRHLFGEGMFTWPVSWSPDGRYLVVQRFLIHTDSSLYLVDLETGEAEKLTPHNEEANFRAGPWSRVGVAGRRTAPSLRYQEDDEAVRPGARALTLP